LLGSLPLLVQFFNFNFVATMLRQKLTIGLNVLYNYFAGPNKIIFRNPAKFLDSLAKRVRVRQTNPSEIKAKRPLEPRR